MLCRRLQQIAVLWALLVLAVAVLALPDSAGRYPDPPPGIAHGGIPYGSISGNVAAFKKSAPSSRSHANLDSNELNVDFTPIEQWL